jgi:hypothetical protein
LPANVSINILPGELISIIVSRSINGLFLLKYPKIDRLILKNDHSDTFISTGIAVINESGELSIRVSLGKSNKHLKIST